MTDLSHVSIRPLDGPDLDAHLDDIARLRIAVFADWPYLYDGQIAYERDYLRTYRNHPGALLLGAFDGDRLVGASSSTPMEEHAEAFGPALRDIGVPLTAIVYGAESVLLPDYRGRGLGHQFFDRREAHARSLGRSHVGFFSVLRPAGDPRRPATARSNDAFWTGRGYAPLTGVTAQFDWRDLGDTEDSAKTLQYWMRAL